MDIHAQIDRLLAALPDDALAALGEGPTSRGASLERAGFLGRGPLCRSG